MTAISTSTSSTVRYWQDPNSDATDPSSTHEDTL